jgi:hypothetical protein
MRAGSRGLALWLVAVVAAAAPARAAEDPAAPAAAPPPGLGALVALPGGILPGEIAEVRRAVDVYLHDFRPEVEEIGPLPGGMRAQIARAVEVARSRDLRLAVVLWWSAQTETRVLTATFVDLRAPRGRPVSFQVDWPHQPDAAFYRLLGLKVRSTLLALVGAPPDAEASAEMRRRRAAAADDRLRFGLEAVASGDIPLEGVAFVPSFGGGLRLDWGRWGFGIMATRGLEERRTSGVAQGDTATTKLVAEASLRVARAMGRLGLFVTLQVGAAHLRTTVRDLTTYDARDTTQWVPVGSIGFLMGYDIGGHVRLLLGPRLDVFMVRGWRTLLGTRVYDTGWVQPGVDLKVLVLF